MKTTELIKLLDKEGNKYGASGKERELYLSINGDFVGTIEAAKLDGWGDGLVTDVTLEVQVDNMEYHDKKIRNQAIDDFVAKYKFCDNRSIQCHKALNCADCIAEQLKEGGAEE